MPLPPAFNRSSDVPLVGREPELATLQSSLETVSSSPTSCFFVGGEPGIGKTRLAREVAARAHENGAAVLYGRCDEALGVPFQAWREALSHLADHVPHHIARRHLDRFGPTLGFLMPGLAAGLASDVDELDTIDANQQELLFRATSDLLSDVARRRPLLVVLDDMQWAHSSTVGLLRHLGRTCAGSVLFIGLYRTTDVAPAHPLTDLVAELEQSGAGTAMTLGGLDDQAQVELVRSMVDAEAGVLAPDIAHTIAVETGGNPFFFTEVVRSALESESVASILDASLAEALPPTVQRVVIRRVARLGESPASTLRVASVFGREFDLDVLSAVLDRSEDDVLNDLEIALSAALVTDAPAGRDRFAFAHDLVHHTLVGELSHSRRARLHARIARAIESIHGPDLGEFVPVVAGHLLAAGDPSLRDLTIRRCREAGQQAAKQLALSEAITWFERALVELGGDDDRERAEVLVELGTQQRNAADQAHRMTLIEAGRIAETLGDVDTLVAAAIMNSRGMNSHVWEIDHERIAMLRAALDALGGEDSAERAELLASLANEQWDADHREQSEDFYREAMQMARRTGDVQTLVRVLVRVSRARNFRLDRDEMRTVSDELRELAHHLDQREPLLLANCLTTVLNTSIRLGLAAETRDAIEAIDASAKRLPLPMFTLPAHLGQCLDAGLRGDIAAYEQWSTDTFHHATAIGDEEAGFIFEGQMFYTAYLRGDLAPILDFSIQVMNERPDVPLYRAVCTLIHVEAGKVDEARALLDTEAAAGIEPSIDMFQIQALVAWADAAATIGHVAAAEQLYDALINLSSEMSGHLVQVGEPIDISLGRLASELHRFEAAERHFAIATQIAEGYHGAWMQARTLLSRAEMMVQRAQENDYLIASELAKRAFLIAEDNDYRGISAQAQKVISKVEEPSD